MKLLQRNKTEAREHEDSGRPLPDEAPEPQPEHEEPRLADPGVRELSMRDYVAIAKRAFGKFNRDHMTSIAAALAYYAFLAIPSALLIAVGLFGIFAGPDAVTTVIGKLNHVMPEQATSLVEGSLKTITQNNGTGLTLLSVGAVLALWSLTGAMQNVIWATNIAYDREDERGFVRKRLIALFMIAFALIGFALAFGVLVLGPHLSSWIGDAVGAKTLVEIVWWIGEWPLLVGGLLLAFAGLMYLAPDVEHPRWKFLSYGALVSLFIWLVASAAFSFYVSEFGSYNKTWGTLSAVVVMLTWLWLSSVALLLGVEINAEAERSRELRRGEPAEVEIQAPAKS